VGPTEAPWNVRLVDQNEKGQVLVQYPLPDGTARTVLWTPPVRRS
jgi:hypothetical protein